MLHVVSDLAFDTRSKEDVTGTIPKPSLASLLEPEDWRRAKAALATALDPQGNGSLVGWDNPESGNKGSFMPVGKAYPSECRDLPGLSRRARPQGATNSPSREPLARIKEGEWTIAEAKPWKKA